MHEAATELARGLLAQLLLQLQLVGLALLVVLMMRP